jgi:uncharacterized protein YjbI with pentapeptide repeats
MANEEHLALLKQGVDVWNAWRRENPEIIPDLREAELGKVNLFNADLGQAKLSKTDFSEAILEEANLVKADLREANLVKADFSRTDLKYANLTEANLAEAEFLEADSVKPTLGRLISPRLGSTGQDLSMPT